jgi:hypothetical protein
MTLHRINYKIVNGRFTSTRSETLFCWAPVGPDGEVEMGQIQEFDDDLDTLSPGWQWQKFELKPIEEISQCDSSMTEQASAEEV